MSRSLRRSVIGFVFSDDQEKILLIKRRDVDAWALPGGGVDPGESPEQAVIREIQEETGFQVAICRPIALYTPINKLTYDTYTFECCITGGALTVGEETGAVSFFPTNALPQSFFFLHKIWLDDACKRLPTLIHEPITQVTYFRLFCYFLNHPIQVVRLLLSRLGLPLNKQ